MAGSKVLALSEARRICTSNAQLPKTLCHCQQAWETPQHGQTQRGLQFQLAVVQLGHRHLLLPATGGLHNKSLQFDIAGTSEVWVSAKMSALQ